MTKVKTGCRGKIKALADPQWARPRSLYEALTHSGTCKIYFLDIQSTLIISTSLSRITAYIEVKFWSLFLHGNLRTGNKILWKRGEIAPNE